MNQLGQLMRYKAWANERIFRVVSGLDAEQLQQPQPIVFGNLLRTLHHVLAMDRVWQAHLQGRSHGITRRNPDDCPALAELRHRQHDMDDWYVGYAEALAPAVADEVVEFSFIGGGEATMSRAEILHHVVNHGTYHRGHVADMLYAMDVMPPTTDLPVFLRDAGGRT